MVQTKGENLGNAHVRLCEILRSSGSCGFNLTKSKWDPYPWVSNVECGSPAESAGVQAGDCLLEVNGEDVLGLRVIEVADKVKARNERVTVMLWNSGVDSKCSPDTLCCGPMPVNLQRLSTCMNNILAALECPVCLDTIPPPAHQCVNGHLICFKCRTKTDKCPVCRLKLFRGRSLLADQTYNSLIVAFDLKDQEETKRQKLLKQKLLGHNNASVKVKQDNKTNFLIPTNKILSRLLRSGKSSSAENLTESNRLDKNSNLLNLLSPSYDFPLGLRRKSLSSNEIFKLDSQSVSRTPSILSSRPGSGLLDVHSVTYSNRPASYHGSVEELQKGFKHEESGNFSNSKCDCPCNPDCKKQITLLSVMKHIQEFHEGPILHFFKPEIELTLPLTLDSSTILAVSCYNTVFIVKILDYLCKSDKNLLWVWKLNSNNDFIARVNFRGNGLNITSEFPVISLKTGWNEVISENHGIILNLTEEIVKLEIKIWPNFLNVTD